jgi:ribosomal subunit interface protein
MKIKTFGRKVNLKENFISMVEKRMAKFDRFFDDNAECQVTVTVETNRQTVEVMVKSQNFLYRAERTAPDMETAFDAAADLIGKQIVKNKEKLGARIKRSENGDYTDFGFDGIPLDDEYRIVREKRFAVKPMMVEEAVLQMNMLNHSFYVFLNAETESICVVYRRKDDDYGLIIPEE